MNNIAITIQKHRMNRAISESSYMRIMKYKHYRSAIRDERFTTIKQDPEFIKIYELKMYIIWTRIMGLYETLDITVPLQTNDLRDK